LRRLIRRSIREAYKLGFKEAFLGDIASVVINKFENIYNNLKDKKEQILSDISKEEKQFGETLEK
jgi:alanyl-tRNA synthetase